jgi:hypothetical protein
MVMLGDGGYFAVVEMPAVIEVFVRRESPFEADRQLDRN